MIHYYKFFCTRDNLKGIRNFVEGILRTYNLSDIEVNQVVLAVDEICANLIIHSHNCNPNDVVELSVRNQPEGITFEIVDKGAVPFDLEQYQKPDINSLVQERRKGGMGLMLVNHVMDQVEVNHENGQAVWRLYKSLRPSKDRQP